MYKLFLWPREFYQAQSWCPRDQDDKGIEIEDRDSAIEGEGQWI